MATTEQPRVGRPSSFERDELVAVALRLGPDDLAVKRVADALDVPRTTVYNHLRSPSELGKLVLSSVLAAVEGDDVTLAGDGWDARLEAFAVHQRDALLAAGPWLRYYDPEVHITSASLRAGDTVLGSLVAAGFTPEAAGRAVIMVLNLVQESVRVHARAQSPGKHDDD